MTNSQIIEKLSSQLIKKIEWRMADLGENYATAKAKVQQDSVAGPAVWAVVDSKFN
jgi:hypothetical protein